MPVLHNELNDYCYRARHRLEIVSHEMSAPLCRKILVIDDDPDLCLGLYIRLKANSYDTCFAHDAESAVGTALAEMPDLIILDLGLPGDDGYSVMQRLSAFPELAGIPVIVVTGRDRFTHETRSRKAGASRFYEKPLDDRRLLMGIRQLLG
jgi:DNA-binding response OmpR family regulator